MGYTVKYNPLPSGEGLYLTVYPLSRPNTDTRIIDIREVELGRGATINTIFLHLLCLMVHMISSYL